MKLDRNQLNASRGRAGSMHTPKCAIMNAVENYDHGPCNCGAFGGHDLDEVTDWGQENVEQAERELSEAAATPRTTPDEVHDALLGLIGLVQLICARDDIPDDIRIAMQTNHRYLDARAVAKAYL